MCRACRKFRMYLAKTKSFWNAYGIKPKPEDLYDPDYQNDLCCKFITNCLCKIDYLLELLLHLTNGNQLPIQELGETEETGETGGYDAFQTTLKSHFQVIQTLFEHFLRPSLVHFDAIKPLKRRYHKSKSIFHSLREEWDSAILELKTAMKLAPVDIPGDFLELARIYQRTGAAPRAYNTVKIGLSLKKHGSTSEQFSSIRDELTSLLKELLDKTPDVESLALRLLSNVSTLSSHTGDTSVLPDDILQLIFSFLRTPDDHLNAVLVSKRWKSVGLSPSSIKNLLQYHLGVELTQDFLSQHPNNALQKFFEIHSTWKQLENHSKLQQLLSSSSSTFTHSPYPEVGTCFLDLAPSFIGNTGEQTEVPTRRVSEKEEGEEEQEQEVKPATTTSTSQRREKGAAKKEEEEEEEEEKEEGLVPKVLSKQEKKELREKILNNHKIPLSKFLNPLKSYSSSVTVEEDIKKQQQTTLDLLPAEVLVHFKFHNGLQIHLDSFPPPLPSLTKGDGTGNDEHHIPLEPGKSERKALKSFHHFDFTLYPITSAGVFWLSSASFFPGDYHPSFLKHCKLQGPLLLIGRHGPRHHLAIHTSSPSGTSSWGKVVICAREGPDPTLPRTRAWPDYQLKLSNGVNSIRETDSSLTSYLSEFILPQVEKGTFNLLEKMFYGSSSLPSSSSSSSSSSSPSLSSTPPAKSKPHRLVLVSACNPPTVRSYVSRYQKSVGSFGGR